MMVEFQITGMMIAVDDNELQTILNWMVTTFGGRIGQAQILGKPKEVKFTILETTFNDAIATITTLKSNYGTQLGDSWQVSYSDAP